MLLSREAVAQTPAAQISCQELTSTIWRFESNHSSQVVDGSQEPSYDAGLELGDARLCASYNARPLCDSLAPKRSRSDARPRRPQIVRCGHAADPDSGARTEATARRERTSSARAGRGSGGTRGSAVSPR